MNTHIHKSLRLAGIVASLYGTASIAQEVQFFDGGYSEMCASAAKNPGAPPRVELTGSRLDVPPLELCTQAIRTAENTSNRAGSYNNRGVLLFAQGLFAESLSDFDAAIRVDDTLAQAHVNRGYALMALKLWADGIAAFDRGLALGTSELARVHYNRGIAHEELGHVREAYQDYLKASELDPLWEEPRQELTRFTVKRN
jgi:tetratricopeptide (TPR) repeat protein